MKIVGREKEINLLESLLEQDEASFVAVLSWILIANKTLILTHFYKP